MPEERSIPDWIFQDMRPTQDKQYFENLTRCIFQGGLNWVIIANKWPNFRQAFDYFDIEKVAKYGVEDQNRLLEDAGIIRNKQKILATIQNAEEFKKIIEEHGSFKKWLDSLDKSNNYQYVVKLLSSRFSRVGPSTAHTFLWSVGEPVKWDENIYHRRPSKLA